MGYSININKKQLIEDYKLNWVNGYEFDNIIKYIQMAAEKVNHDGLNWQLTAVNEGLQWLYLEDLDKATLVNLNDELNKLFHEFREQVRSEGIELLFKEMLTLLTLSIREKNN